MGVSLGQLLIILLIILVLFGAGRLPQVIADLSKGIKLFRSEMSKKNKKNFYKKNKNL
ncbi:MAG: twin-arginine translocase TatA/TatE family subunit [Rickettsia sp.]|nr:twin-arginine translocase TatA/TatE family subunit [Rickettsia sp.]